MRVSKVAYIDATTTSFGLKYSIEKVGLKRIEVVGGSLRYLCFGYEKTVMFGVEVMVYTFEKKE